MAAKWFKFMRLPERRLRMPESADRHGADTAVHFAYTPAGAA